MIQKEVINLLKPFLHKYTDKRAKLKQSLCPSINNRNFIYNFYAYINFP